MSEERKTFFNEVNGVEAQRLILCLLMKLTPDLNKNILDALKSAGHKPSQEIRDYLQSCIGLASELRVEPDRYKKIEDICSTILKRQGHKGTKREYADALGIKTREQRLRVENSTSVLRIEQIKAICSGFKSSADRLLWEDLLLGVYRDYPLPNRSQEIEVTALTWLHENLVMTGQYNALFEKQDVLDKQRLKTLFDEPERTIKSRFGGEPHQLYDVISQLAKEKHVTVASITWDALLIDPKTWYAWRMSWMKAEQSSFADGIPKTRLSRTHMMMMALLFDLNYLESTYFLALAGHRYLPGEPDDEIVKYLIWKESATAESEKTRKERLESVKEYVRDGIYRYKW